jgi:F-type H+-transporting ATPase subunit epsilon
MTEGAIQVHVLTNTGTAVEDEAVSVVAPGELGYLGVLRRHAPLVTTLVPGRLRYRTHDGTTKTFRLGAGLMEIVRDRLTILTESISQPEQG